MTFLYILDWVAILLFFASYYKNCYRKGYRIDIWHLQLFFLSVLPNLIMLPFAMSEMNGIVLKEDLGAVLSVVPQVFKIALVGYSSMLFGGYLWRLRLGLGMRRALARSLDLGPRCSVMLMSSRNLLVFQSTLCLLLQIVMLTIYFSSSGFGFDLRDFTFANPTLRPAALITSTYSITIASHCLARYTETKEKILLACTLFLTIGLVFFGTRGNIASIYLGVIYLYLMKLRNRVSIFRILGIALILVVGAFYLGEVRGGNYSLSDLFSSFIFLLLYGNNFSDLRDFAWVYAAWDHNLWGGKTYLAGITAFVPRFASSFRDTWGAGAAMDLTVGIDSHTHPGLRPGAFGEGFFNFGLAGVIVVGLILGIISRHVDTNVKAALAAPRPSMIKAFASTMLLGVAGFFAVSGGATGLYVLGGVYIFSWLCLQTQTMVSGTSHRSPAVELHPLKNAASMRDTPGKSSERV